MKRMKWLALLAIFSLFAVACSAAEDAADSAVDAAGDAADAAGDVAEDAAEAVEDAVTDGPIIAYSMDGAQMSVRDKGPLWVIYPFDSSPEYRTAVIFSRSIWQLDRIEVVE